MLGAISKIQPDPKGGWQCRQKKESLQPLILLGKTYFARGVARTRMFQLVTCTNSSFKERHHGRSRWALLEHAFFHEICRINGQSYVEYCKRLWDCASVAVFRRDWLRDWRSSKVSIFPAQIRKDIQALEHAKPGLEKFPRHRLLLLIDANATGRNRYSVYYDVYRTFHADSLREKNWLHVMFTLLERGLTTPTGIISEITFDKSTEPKRIVVHVMATSINKPRP